MGISNNWAKLSKWNRGFIEIHDGKTCYFSIVFTWDLPKARKRILKVKDNFESVVVGGNAVYLLPNYLSDISIIGYNMPFLHKHNSDATFTSRGCIRKCSFCAVPKIEGSLIELDKWEVKPIICDNNLLATNWNHFCNVIKKLENINCVDFNQGLDARLLTKSHAKEFAKLNNAKIRLAWDHIKTERQFSDASNLLLSEGISPKQIYVYVLYGYNDTPEDAYYRMETIRKLGFLPNPMRYQPLNSLKRSSYIDKNWTRYESVRFGRYYANLRIVGHVPFNEFYYNVKYAPEILPQYEI